jgi:hypothetical protein
MDREHFDRLSRLVASAGSRRDAVRLLIAGAIAAAVGGAVPAGAGKRRARERVRQRTRTEQILHCTDQGCVNCAAKKIGPGVNLTRCDLNRRLDLAGTNLGGSNLTKTCLGDTDLRNVRFRGANLSGACLCGANLSGADFRGSNVTPAQLACARVGCDTILPNGKPAVACGKGETCCDGTCVNTRTDRTNCGACGTLCETSTNPCLEIDCIAGQCVTEPKNDGTACDIGGETGVCCAAGSSATCVIGTICCSSAQCDPGDTCCGGLCFNLQTDPEHCGSCDNDCPETKADGCKNGECTCGNAPACLQSTTCCPGGCVDTATDTANCGGCGKACNPEVADRCSFGECLCGDDVECSPGELCFSGECRSF